MRVLVCGGAASPVGCDIKTCRKCGVSKSIEEYHIRHDSGKRRTECKSCRDADRKTWMAAHPEVHKRAKKKHYEKYKPIQRQRALAWSRANREKVHDTHLKRTFGINRAEYQRMFDQQNGACAVCKKVENVIDKRSGRPRRLHVDHDHQTGNVRQLLCTRCNMAIGYLCDDPNLAEAAAAYLKRHSSIDGGTADVVRRARAAGIEVMEVE